MTAPWMPCEVGKPLYKAYEREWDIDDWSPDWAARLLALWDIWDAHRDGCEKCKIGDKK